MIKTRMFIHATRAVKNMRGLPSLVLETAGKNPILVNMIMRLQKSETLDCIHIVTSNNPCDDAVAEAVNPISVWDTNIPVELIRIPSNNPYAITESNIFRSSDLLYNIPHYAFYSAEHLTAFCATAACDLALVCTADDVPLIEPETIDHIVRKYSKKGVAYGCLYRHEIEIFAVPVAELSAKTAACQYKRNSRFKDESARVKDTVNNLISRNSTLDRAKIEREKLDAIKQYFGRPIHCKEILDKFYDGKTFGVACNKNQENEFYPVHSQRQLETLRTFTDNYDSLTLETFRCAYDTLGQSVYPSVLEIEVTGRCNLSCADCPNTVMTRPKKDMDADVYRSIIDRFGDMTAMVFLSGYGEPTLHPKIIDFIKYAKDKQITRVCIETNGSTLTESYLEQLIDAQLDILVVNVDAIDIYGKSGDLFASDAMVELVMAVKKKHNSAVPYLVVQTVNRSSRQQQIDYYYDRWEYLTDATAIQSFNDFCDTFDRKEFIDMSPADGIHFCQKTSNNLFILSDGKPAVCKQRFNGSDDYTENDLLSYWQNHFVKGGRYEFCKGCSQKYFRDIFVTHYPDFILRNKLTRKMHTLLIDEKIDEGNNFFKTKKYAEALKCWEQVLSVYPDNQDIHEKLQILETIAP
ncbi:MAG: radical SAM protein [Candidatus Auribacterota bacterium]|jgi:organic radical activating enzyme|nr:radical SAM protein [Candidatus Auribacterota bacterium]